MKQRGFTVIEVLVVLTFVIVGAVVFFTQKADIDAGIRDDQRKTAINAMYYSLEEAYYEEKGYYPESIDSATLRTVDPELFTDPSGNEFGSAESEYRYESSDCNAEKQCKSYKLTATMEREGDYTKDSRRN